MSDRSREAWRSAWRHGTILIADGGTGSCGGTLMGGVFINYRGEDSQTAAALIDRELTSRFGRESVFLDSRSIPVGVDFAEELLGRLRTCSVVLVVIGPR